MLSLNVVFYSLVALAWVAMAGFIIIRVPKCKSIPKSAQVFVIIFLLLQIFIQGQHLYEVLSKENIISVTKPLKTQVVSDTTTLNNLSNLLLSSYWFNILTFLLMVVLYYIIFKAIYQCNDQIIPPKLIWSFVVTTIVLHFVSASVRSTIDNKILLNAMAK